MATTKDTEVKQFELVDVEEIKSLTFAKVNGVTYFGKITEKDGKISIKSAIQVETSSLKENVKTWLKANNRGTLLNPRVGGQITYSIMDLTEPQIMVITEVVSAINMKLKYALVDMADKIIEGN